MTEEYHLHTFANGIRLIHKQVKNTKIAHCGYFLEIGSRDEKSHQVGIAHFWEHMTFKGTKKRKSYYIINSLESVGGELNAFTSKEHICFYASTLDNHFEKSVELLTDITFNSVFPEKEIIKEKSVVLKEIAMYRDDLADAIQDEFDEMIFNNHALGNNILGTEENVKRFTKKDLDDFILENLNTNKVIFSSISAMPFNKVVKKVEKYLKDIPTFKNKKIINKFNSYIPVVKERKKITSQAHCAIGKTAYSLFSDKKMPFIMLVNLLGGSAMNSRLNLTIREKYGFVYSIEAHYSTFLDTGLFAIYFATEKRSLNRCIRLVQKELTKLRENKLGIWQLHNAKQQLMGQMAMNEESNIGLMLMLGKSMLTLNKVESLNNIFDKIKLISSEDILEVANDIFDTEKLSMLTYLPQ